MTEYQKPKSKIVLSHTDINKLSALAIDFSFMVSPKLDYTGRQQVMTLLALKSYLERLKIDCEFDVDKELLIKGAGNG